MIGTVTSFFDWIRGIIAEFKFWAIVQPWECAVRTRCGRRAILWQSGLHWRLPIVDDVRIVNNRLRISSFPCITISTKDGKVLSIAGNVGFHIADPLRAMLRLQQPEMTCAALAQSAVAAFVTARNLPEIIVAELEESTRMALIGQADGIEFEFVRVVDFAAVKTFRLLQDQWRPSTDSQQHL